MVKLKTSCGKFLNLVHYFPYDVKLRVLAHSRSFLANQKAINAIVGAENLLNKISLLQAFGSLGGSAKRSEQTENKINRATNKDKKRKRKEGRNRRKQVRGRNALLASSPSNS